MKNEYQHIDEALEYLIDNQMLTQAKQVNELYDYFQGKVTTKSLSLLYPLDFDFRNLKNDFLTVILHKFNGSQDIQGLENLLKYLKRTRNVNKLSSEYYIDMLNLMIHHKTRPAVEELVSILIAQGIYPSLFAFNYLLRSALHTQDFKGFRDTLATMTTHGIDFGADTYEVLFEELFVRNDLRGCLDMMSDMRNKGISPSRIAVRYIMKLCLNEDSESVLLHAIEECKKFGFPFDVHMCNALLSFYCKNNMDDELEKTLDMMSDHGINLNASSYTRLLYYYQSHGQQGKVSFLIQHMLDSGMLPDNRILDNYDFQPILHHAVDNLQKQPSPFQFDDDVFRLFDNDTEEEPSSDLKFNE